MALRKLLFFTLVLCVPQLLTALELEGVQFNFGTAIILNAEELSVSPTSHVTASVLGVSVPMKFNEILYFEPGIRFFGFNVLLDPDTYKPVPAAIETADRISVLGIELRPEIGAVFDLGESFHLGFTGAPSFMLRFPIEAHDDAGDTEKTAVLEYYFSSFRFVDLYAGGFFTWDFSENVALKIKLGTDIPVYHLWDGDDAAFYDQLRITPEFSLLWRF